MVASKNLFAFRFHEDSNQSWNFLFLSPVAKCT